MRRRRWLLIVPAFGLFACGGSHSASTNAPAAPAAVVAPAAPAAPAKASTTDDDVSALVGHEAPAWEASTWFNSPPLTLAALRGKVVFVRWFTSPDCPFCTGSAPALRELHAQHAQAGLVVVGMYHHKAETPLDPEDVRGWAKHYGYEFPVAIDDGWRTLRRWWLDGHPDRGFTSVSFLIDRHGVIRRVHLGGLIDVKSAEFASIDADVQELLAEP
jgi:peroxiredoxin